METASLPKAELHCHLIGTIDARLLRCIEAQGTAPLIAPDRVLDPHQQSSADDFLSWLDSLGAYREAHWQHYIPVLKAHIDNLVEQNVTHSELMISPTMFPLQWERDQRLEAFAKFVAAAKDFSSGRVALGFLLLIPRRLPETAFGNDREFAISAFRAGLADGISIAGLDYDLPISRFFPLLERLRDAGLGIEVHSGEHTGPDEVRELVNSGLVDRLGHGVRAFEDMRLAEQIARKGIHVEFCPTSNVRTGVVRHICELPIATARDLGVKFSINTDDPGAFGCTMTSEFEAIGEAFGFGGQEFERIYGDARSALFGGHE